MQGKKCKKNIRLKPKLSTKRGSDCIIKRRNAKKKEHAKKNDEKHLKYPLKEAVIASAAN